MLGPGEPAWTFQAVAASSRLGMPVNENIFSKHNSMLMEPHLQYSLQGSSFEHIFIFEAVVQKLADSRQQAASRPDPAANGH